jgi:hypothetical protein
MRQALSDPRLLADALPGPSWSAWKVLLTAAAGETLDDSEREIFQRLTGRPKEPGCMVEIMLTVGGRRAGKSKAMAAFAVWLSTCVDWTPDLSLGETAHCLFVAPSLAQAAIVDDYVRAVLRHVELLSSLVEEQTADCISLKRSVALQVQAASATHARGKTACAIVCDESAFLPCGDDRVNSGEDVLTALRPSLSTLDGPLLLTSSPSGAQGIVWELYRRHYGPDGDPRCLVVKSDTKGLNPTFRASVLERAYAHDPTAAAAEYGAEFREPSSVYLARDIIERAIDQGVTTRPMLPGVRYVAFTDAATGSGRDSFALCIAHRSMDKERPIAVLDLLLEQRPPFNPLDVIVGLCGHLRAWGITEVMGDQFGKPFISMFAQHGIAYQVAPLNTSEIFLHALPVWTSNSVAMLDGHSRAVDQLANLRRRIGQSNRETVEHPKNAHAHDDLAAVVCGAIYQCTPVQHGLPSSWQIPGCIVQPRLYFGDNSADTMQAWLRVQGNRNPFYAPRPDERSIHHAAPDPRMGNALW